jgi:ribose/xylose/arabinose/galactoside ABC-type transport system permease subunit
MKKTTKLGSFFASKMSTLLCLLALIVLVFSILTGGRFLRPRNLKNIINGMSVISLLTVGAGCLLVSGQVDLSAGAVGTLTGLLFAIFYTNFGIPIIIAAVLSLLAASVFGFVNALLINRFGTQGFITTMATASVASGLGHIFSGARAINIDNGVFNAIGTRSIFDGYLPISVIIAVAFFVVYGAMMSKTQFGHSVYLVGGNPSAAFLSGIDPRRISYILFVNSSVIGGLAGLLLASRMKSGTINGITNSQFSGMTAAILGGISFGGGSGGLGGAFVGLLILNAFNNGISIIEIPPYWQTVASGGLLLLALSVDFAGERARAAARRRSARRADTSAA